MTKPADEAEHTHDSPAVDWFKILDVFVWSAVAIIVALGLEWLVGKIVRERIAAGADRYRARVTAAQGPAQPDA